MWKLGLMPRHSFSGNILFFEFSVLCLSWQLHIGSLKGRRAAPQCDFQHHWEPILPLWQPTWHRAFPLLSSSLQWAATSCTIKKSAFNSFQNWMAAFLSLLLILDLQPPLLVSNVYYHTHLLQLQPSSVTFLRLISSSVLFSGLKTSLVLFHDWQHPQSSFLDCQHP